MVSTIFFSFKASSNMPSYPSIIQNTTSREVFTTELELELDSHLSRMFDTNVMSRLSCQEPTFWDASAARAGKKHYNAGYIDRQCEVEKHVANHPRWDSGCFSRGSMEFA
jgi:hypothetical protein